MITINPAGSFEVVAKNNDKPDGVHGGLCNLNGGMDIQLISKDSKK